MSKFTGRERAILFLGVMIGLGLAASTHIAEAGGSIRPLDYNVKGLHDPMMPDGFKAASPNTAIDLSDWKIGAVMANQDTKLVYVDNTILHIGSHYRGIEIIDIALTTLTVRKGEKQASWEIPDNLYNSIKQQAVTSASTKKQHNSARTLFENKQIDLNKELR